MAEHLTPLDAAFLELEERDESSHMHVGWALVFDPPPGRGTPSVGQVRDLLRERMGALPRFGKRLSSARVRRFSWPAWVDDPDFDVANHVRRARLPDPGGEDELLDWLGDFYSHRLDRAHPLWEITLLDGLDAGRWALACKIHHSLVDGITGALITGVLLDTDPAPRPGAKGILDQLPSPPEGDPGAATPLGLLGRGARAGLDAALHPRKLARMLDRSRALAEFIVREELTSAPESSLNPDIGATRRLAQVTVPLADLKAVKNELGGTVNDVVLATCAGGLRRLLRHRGERLPAEGLRAQVPVSLRRTEELLALGNRVGSLFVRLPVSARTARSRYRRTVAAAERLKTGKEGLGAETLVELVSVAPPVLHATLAQLSFTPRLFNVTITNVPGPQLTLYAFGAPVRQVIPLVPIFARHSLGIAVVSYDGNVTFGLNADRAAVPDLEVVRDGLAESLAELTGLARPAEPTRA